MFLSSFYSETPYKIILKYFFYRLKREKIHFKACISFGFNRYFQTAPDKIRSFTTQLQKKRILGISSYLNKHRTIKVSIVPTYEMNIMIALTLFTFKSRIEKNKRMKFEIGTKYKTGSKSSNNLNCFNTFLRVSFT